MPDKWLISARNFVAEVSKITLVVDEVCAIRNSEQDNCFNEPCTNTQFDSTGFSSNADNEES